MKRLLIPIAAALAAAAVVVVRSRRAPEAPDGPGGNWEPDDRSQSPDRRQA